jgi:hypothetical protein
MFVESPECFGATNGPLQLQRKSNLINDIDRSCRTIAPHQIGVKREFLGWWGRNSADVGHLRRANQVYSLDLSRATRWHRMTAEIFQPQHTSLSYRHTVRYLMIVFDYWDDLPTKSIHQKHKYLLSVALLLRVACVGPTCIQCRAQIQGAVRCRENPRSCDLSGHRRLPSVN